MPSVVQLQTQAVNSVNFMLKERVREPVVSAFTAVNGRSSPPSPRRPNGTNGMSTDHSHVRPFPPPHAEQTHERKVPLPGREQWDPVPRASGNAQYSTSPPLPEKDRSPQSPPKRKRSSSEEDDRSYHSPASAPDHTRHRVDSYSSGSSSPEPSGAMEHSRRRTLPPMNHSEHERNWPSREVQDAHPHVSHYRDNHGSMNPNPISASRSNNTADGGHSQIIMERSDTTELTRSGVLVDPKKRKRQFANRTKTGCGTCRRRKKKCDEAKPECNNCQRGGFVCEGYASKMTWPKNGLSKHHPPLQAKDRYPLEPGHQFHGHASSRESYQEPGSTDGGRSRPIVVEEHDPQIPRNVWPSWSEHSRPSHPPEQSQPPEYSQTPPTATHSRPPPNPPSEHYSQHNSSQGTPAQRQPRIYHHTPQTMSQVVNSEPGTTTTEPPPVHHQAQAPVHHVSHHSSHHGTHQGPSTGPPGPPPPQYALPPPPPQRRERSEKDKMLNGESFNPYHPTLVGEREHCSKAVFRFNMTSSDRVTITREERYRHFQALVAAKWIPRPDMDSHYRGLYMPGHVGVEVFVDTPFHCDYGYNLVIGDMVTIGPGCKFMDSGKITIGRNARIGAGVTVDTQKVPTDTRSVKGSHGTVVAAEVSIGDNVYIGANATILAGVKIGTGAIIHPGSVVMKDVPPDCVAEGNPANVQSVNWNA